MGARLGTWLDRALIGAVVPVAILSSICLLDSCATKPAPLPPVSASVCLPLKSYSPAEQKALAAQLKTLPGDSPVAQAFVDFERMRDADRACLSSK